MNADDRLSLEPLGRVEGGDGIVEGSHVADVCPQPTIPDSLDDLTQESSVLPEPAFVCQYPSRSKRTVCRLD